MVKNERKYSSSTTQIGEWLSEEKLLLLSSWARDYNMEGVAERVGVSRTTLWKWAKKEPAIKKALEISREIVDYKVENALLKRALGYKTVETKTIIGKQDREGNRPVRIEKIERELAPDVTACLAWLNNRAPDKWRRNRDNIVEMNDEDNNVTINIIKKENSKEEGKKKINLEDDDDWSDVI